MALYDNLVAYWSLDETSGTRFDSRGSNHLTDNNNVGSTAGVVANAADFEADNSQTLSIASNADVQLGDEEFTIAFWVKMEDKSVNRMFFSKFAGVGQRSYHVSYTAGGTDRIRFIVSGDGTAASIATASSFGSPSIDTWYFVTAWHDPVANTISIQINNGTTNFTSHSAGIFASTSPLELGGVVTASQYHDGLMDEVGLWRRILTSDEKADLYNNGAGRNYAYINAGSYRPKAFSLLGVG